ncbi:MAG: LacI family transcriptional regulator [Treponema sp.]|nr:LacI family transcriptional regulator [Treponema sp.]
MKRTTIEDIAKKTNLSNSTVARAINNSGYISKINREKIEQAIEELNYTPNKLAQGLRKEHTMTLGHIMPVSILNPFYSLIARNIEENARRLKYSIFTKFCYTSDENINAEVKDLMGSMVEGIILTSLPSNINFEILANYKIPLVFIERTGNLKKENITNADIILLNSFKGSFDATDMLIKYGHKRIAYVGPLPTGGPELERYEGYAQAIKNAFGELSPKYIFHAKNYLMEYGYAAAADVFNARPKPTAIYCSSDMLVVGIMQYLYEKKIKVPDDISVIGYDNTYSTWLPPKITAVANNYDEIGRNAVEMIVNRIIDGYSDNNELIIDPYIIDRNSVKKN